MLFNMFFLFFQNQPLQTTSEVHSPVMSSTTPGVPIYDSFIYEQTENKSSEYIFQEVEGSEGTVDPPENPSTQTACHGTRNWGLVIDRGARVLFPLTYAAFNITYFILFHF